MAKTIVLGGCSYTLDEINNCEFYRVEPNLEGEGKVAHVDGYVWRYEDGTYRHSYYCFCYLQLPTTQEDLDDALMECSMYEQDGYSEDEIADLVADYFGDGGTINPLPIEEVTNETECGYYVNVPRK